ncbi:hypothetical protein C2E21_7426 [Chlorella sorokiniana]|uniref:Uncharacterized protein n=1 Tax=Chlorella sorokiniana TaxID=3076 RepID=A0A2P6THR0_CHLSO|nr:hypothetical protein C2E21_7426 [Chlorella sorokiniana]|eukprot:PRW33835.1 hypothetical protein C2E21_7426 [Chlorella sorokiniana]
MQASAAARTLAPACAAAPSARRGGRRRRAAPIRASGPADEGGSSGESPAAAGGAPAPLDVPPPAALDSAITTEAKKGTNSSGSVWNALKEWGTVLESGIAKAGAKFERELAGVTKSMSEAADELSGQIAAANARFEEEVERGAQNWSRMSEDLNKTMDPVELNSAAGEEAAALAVNLRAPVDIAAAPKILDLSGAAKDPVSWMDQFLAAPTGSRASVDDELAPPASAAEAAEAARLAQQQRAAAIALEAAAAKEKQESEAAREAARLAAAAAASAASAAEAQRAAAKAIEEEAARERAAADAARAEAAAKEQKAAAQAAAEAELWGRFRAAVSSAPAEAGKKVADAAGAAAGMAAGAAGMAAGMAQKLQQQQASLHGGAKDGSDGAGAAAATAGTAEPPAADKPAGGSSTPPTLDTIPKEVTKGGQHIAILSAPCSTGVAGAPGSGGSADGKKDGAGLGSSFNAGAGAAGTGAGAGSVAAKAATGGGSGGGESGGSGGSGGGGGGGSGGGGGGGGGGSGGSGASGDEPISSAPWFRLLVIALLLAGAYAYSRREELGLVSSSSATASTSAGTSKRAANAPVVLALPPPKSRLQCAHPQASHLVRKAWDIPRMGCPSTFAAAILALSCLAQGAAAGYVVTAADPVAVLQSTSALLAGVGAADPGAQPAAEALQARLNAPAAQAVSTRALGLGGQTQLGPNSTVMDGNTLDELAAFLASPSNARALQAAAAADDALADLLHAPPFNRTERCADALRGNVSSEIANCYCNSAQPWPHCDALLHRWLVDAWRAVESALPNRTAGIASQPLAHPGRRLAGGLIYCDGATGLFSFDAAAGGCVHAYCSINFVGVGKIYGQVEGCAWAVSVNYDKTVAGDQQTAEVCDGTSCSTISLSELANVDRSGYMFDAFIAGEIGVCISLFGLQDLLASFGFTSALCQTVGGMWRPLQGQVSMNGRMQLGWSIANLYAEFRGDMQLVDPSDNKLCDLAALDSRLGCKSWCSWEQGQGDLVVTAGWEVLWMGPSKTITLLDDPVVCRDPPSVPAVTTPSSDASSSNTDTTPAASSDASSSSSADGSSASGECTMRGPIYDRGLMGGTVLDGPTTVDTWRECCVACQGWSGCTGWAWIGSSKQCGGSPCCWLKDVSNAYEEDLPGAVISYAGLVDD